jgi:hypothetical protein
VKKLIFVASPVRPIPEPHILRYFPDPDSWQRRHWWKDKLQSNLNKAKDYCKLVIAEGHCPLAPHLIFPQFLDEEHPADRELGIELGLTYILKADELWYWDKPSDGMQKEIRFAYKNNVQIVYKGTSDMNWFSVPEE